MKEAIEELTKLFYTKAKENAATPKHLFELSGIQLSLEYLKGIEKQKILDIEELSILISKEVSANKKNKK